MNHIEFLGTKILDTTQLQRVLAFARHKEKKIVFTNGCFDIVHRGHVEYLAQASDCGDMLIVGLNSDASVRRLKGPTRPVNDQQSRAIVMASLKYVDYVVIFEQDTPYELIKQIQPDVLIKGGDWKVEEIVGNDIVTARGGKVLTIPFVDGFSTTSTIEKMK